MDSGTEGRDKGCRPAVPANDGGLGRSEKRKKTPEKVSKSNPSPTSTYPARVQSAVIINNMSKLVDNPIDAAPFLPLLLPALETNANSIADPEAR